MEAVVLAGGLGTRLLPLTERRPKHLLPVGGVPFVAHQLAKLASAGVDRVVLATSYRGEEFRPVLGDGTRFGLELCYVREAEPLGTGGAIRHAAEMLQSGRDEPVVVLNGDVLSAHDLATQVERLQAVGADASLHLVGVADPRPFGAVPTAPDGRVTGFVEKSPEPVCDQVNAGCYVLRRAVIDAIPPGRVVSVERETFPALLGTGHLVVGYREDSYWLDVGTPAALVCASCDLVSGAATSPAHGAAPADQLVQDGADVDASARVGGGSVVGTGAVVAAGAVVAGSVVMPGARVGADAAVVASALGFGARVGAGARLHGCAVGDDAVVSPGAELERGARVACGAVVVPERPDGPGQAPLGSGAFE